jgi:formylglycine-generating enzyme required for sulfatase activity
MIDADQLSWLLTRVNNAFVRCFLVKRKEAEYGLVDLYGHYQEWCRDNHLRSFPSGAFSRIAKEKIEITLGLKLRYDLPGDNGKPRRAFRAWL